MIVTKELLETNAGISSVVKTLTDDKQIDRYAGLRPFVKEDCLIFFGRHEETEKLITSIRVNPAFILYGKSGLGKSSLVQAGLLPKLAAENMIPAVIRFYNQGSTDRDSRETPLGIITREILKKVGPTVPEQYKNDPLALLNYLPENETLLLIFDQFEEFLYYDKEVRQSAITLMRELIGYASSTKSKNKPYVKLLFLIRSDRFYLMKEVEKKIPGILGCGYELTPLTVDKAEEAMVLPVQINLINDGKNIFKTTSFEYSPEALTMILGTLKNQDGEIESSQLQIICKELEEIAYRKFKSSGNTTNILGPEDFDGEAGLKNILNTFYWKQIEKLKNDPDLKLSERDVNKIRILIENDLVSGNKRIIQSEDRVKEVISEVKPGVATLNNIDKVNFIIDKLLSLRLIREEDSHLGKVYEITHDTLLPSIIESRDERIKKEQANKRFKRLAPVVVIFVLLITSGFVFSVYQSHLTKQRADYREKLQLLSLKRRKDSIRYLSANADSLKHLYRDLDKKNRNINSLVDSIRIKNEELKNSLAQTGKLNNQVINLNNQSQELINGLNSSVANSRRMLIGQKIKIDSLQSLLFIYRKQDTSKSSKISGQALIKEKQDLLKQINSTRKTIDSIPTKAYSESWFKKGYSLQFDNIKLTLQNINEQKQTIRIQICDVVADRGCNRPIEVPTLNAGQHYQFVYQQNMYSIQFDRLASVDGLYQDAAFIKFAKGE